MINHKMSDQVSGTHVFTDETCKLQVQYLNCANDTKVLAARVLPSGSNHQP